MLAYDTEGDTGCFVEVDLEYPDRLHDLHDMYPLAPEPMDITDNMVSQTSRDLASGQIGGRKLVLHLGPRRHHICHIRNLQFYRGGSTKKYGAQKPQKRFFISRNEFFE